MYAKALIALDGSAPSYRAVEAAASLADSIEEFSLIYVAYIPHAGVLADGQAIDTFPQQYYNELLDNARHVLSKAEQMLAGHPRIISRIESGLPAETILNIAEKEHYNLIIMGSRGLNSLQRLFLGSVSNKVLSLAHCAVMLIK